MAPPIKRQAVEGQQQQGGGGGPPPTADASAQRRAQLQNLRAGYSNRPTMGPPPARGTIPSIGFNPAAKAPANSNNAAGVNNGNHPNRPTGIPQRTAPNLARESDIFPSAPKAPPPAASATATTPAVARRLDVAFQQPTPAAAPAPTASETSANNPPSLATEPPTASSPPAQQPPKKVGFAPPTTPAANKGVTFAKSPEVASPPPPAPVTSPEPQTPFPNNSRNAGRTPFPNTSSNGTAGHTPFPGKAVPTTPEDTSPAAAPPASHKTVQFAGHTPHPNAAKAGAQQGAPSTNRRDKLAQMRQVADTPPKANKSNENASKPMVSFAAEESAELRMQKQLTEETKKREYLNRKVAELEDQLAQQVAKAAATAGKNNKGVSFMPPPSPSKPMDRLTPTRKRAATPHPKRDQGDSEQVDRQFLEQATEDVPYKFEAGDDDPEEDGSRVEALFVVRRPYGLGDLDQELWFAAGEKNAKLYKRDATVEQIETIEVAVQIGADESVLLLYNEADVRHQNAIEGTWNKFGSFYERGDALGTVAYIDVDANEKEYSLDKLVEQAIDVREHYCASLRNMAIGLQRRGLDGGNPISPVAMQTLGSPMASPPAQDGSPKVDACVGTDPVKMSHEGAGSAATAAPPPQQQAPPPPAPMAQDTQSDTFSLLLGMMSSILYFCVIKIPFKAVTTLVVWTLVAILGCIIYLLMLNTMGSTGVAPPLYYYHNPPGIM